MYHGWADPLIPPQSSINYFNALADIDGGSVQQVDFRPGDDGRLAAILARQVGLIDERIETLSRRDKSANAFGCRTQMNGNRWP